VKGWAGDPEKPLRQRTYLRALATLSSVVVTEGVFLTHPVCMRLAHPRAAGPKYAWVVKTEEKGSDVNIATHLIHDAHRNRYDTAVVISNDSDLLRPIQIVRREFNKKVGIVNPRDQRPIRILRDESDFQKTLRTGLLRESQFPDVMSDARGEFTNPFIFHRTETRVRPTPPL
jgi:hypothetical protein